MSDKVKRAALCLHSLDESDQNWLLERLPDDFRQQLTRMVEEVDTIGLPKDRSWLKDITEKKTMPSRQKPMADPKLPVHVNIINQTPPDTIVELLQHEPDGVIACLLIYYRWLWLDVYFKQCKHRQRKRITAIARQIKQNKNMKVIEATVKSFANAVLRSQRIQNKVDEIPTLHQTKNQDGELHP